jgi:hypothetical protein
MQMSKFAEEKLPNMKLIFNMNILNFIILTAILTIGNATKGATYYLKVAKASTAHAASSWNTAQDGTGTNLSSWRTAGTNHTYIVPTGVYAIWNIIDTIGNSGASAQSYTFIINGTLDVNNNDRIVFDGASNIVTFTINGTLVVDENNGNTFETHDINYVQFVFSEGSFLSSNNRYGITGSATSIFPNNAEVLLYFDDRVNYEFRNTGGNSTLNGLQDSVGKLTINTTGRTCTLTENLIVQDSLIIEGGTLVCAAFTLTIGINAYCNHSIGSITFTSGTFNINGMYVHSSGIFSMTGNAKVVIGSVGTLHLNSGVFNMLERTLTVQGNITRTAGYLYFTPGSGTALFTNTLSLSIPVNTFLTYPNNFRLNGSGGVVLNGKTACLCDSLNTVTFTLGNLTIISDTTYIRSINSTGGRIVGNTSATINFYGTSSFTLRLSQNVSGVTNALKNLIISSSNQVNLQARLRLVPNGTLQIATGGLFTTNGNLVIESNASGHASVTAVNGTLASSSGDSLILYIPGGTRGFRLFGNPFTSALAIGQFMNGSTEIDVTGSGGSGNGFTTTQSNAPSAYTYNTSSNIWSPFTTTSQTIPVGFGAHILVRGIKGQGLNGNSYTPLAASIRLAGQFRSGNVVTNLSDAGFGWNLVANPYPSNIDIDQISGGNWVNVNAAIYGYDKVNRTYSAYSKNVGNAVNNLSNIIEMGSSFLAEVTAAGSASITFTEAIKTSASSTVGGNPIFTPKADRLNQFKINLSGAEGSEGFFQDECMLSFGNTSNSTPEFDAQSDAWDLGGEMLNVSIITQKNDYLAINEYPSIEKQTDPIPLKVWSKNIGEYTLAFTEISILNENIQIWLRDKYKSEVHLLQESPYKFTITDMEESYGANRFELFTNVTSSIQNIKSLSPLKLFPNPLTSSSKEIDVFIAGEGHSFIIPRIYDMSGRLIFEGAKIFVTINRTNKISLPLNLNAQNYILTCETAQGIFNKQLSIIE